MSWDDKDFTDLVTEEMLECHELDRNFRHRILRQMSDHAFEKLATFIIRKNGSNYESLYGHGANQAGKKYGTPSTDPTGIIQNVLTDMLAGDSLFIENADYTVEDTLTCSKTDVVIRGESWKTRILGGVGTAGKNVVSLSAERQNIENLYIEKTQGGAGAALKTSGGYYSTVKHCKLFDSYGSGNGCLDCSGDELNLYDNYLRGKAVLSAVYPKVMRNFGLGTLLKITRSHNLSMIGNIWESSGVYIKPIDSGTPITNMKIDDVFDRNRNGANPTEGEIASLQIENLTVSPPALEGNVKVSVITSYEHGVYLKNCKNIVLVCPVVKNSGYTKTSGTYHGIVFDNVQDCSVIGGRLFDDQATKTQGYGVTEINGSDYNIFLGVNARGNYTGGINKTGLNSIKASCLE